METFRRHVLKEATEKLLHGEPQGLALRVRAAAVREGDAVSVGGDEGLVAERGAINVATEILEHSLRSVDDGFREDDPRLRPERRREGDLGKCVADSSQQTRTEDLGERFDGDQVERATLRRLHPRAPVVGEAAAWDEHVDVRVPLERAGPRVKDGEHADLRGAEMLRVGAESGERLEGGAEERCEQCSLMLTHEAAQLVGHGEDDVEVRHRQEEFALSGEPAGGGVVAALRARAVAARVKEEVLVAALVALADVPAELGRAARGNGTQGGTVTGQHGRAEALHVPGSVPPHDVSEAKCAHAKTAAADYKSAISLSTVSCTRSIPGWVTCM
jgi:hypothetical protein